MNNLATWQPGPVNPQLPRHELHVWRIALDGHDESMLAIARNLLSTDETTRADRFVVEAPRRRLVLARSAMRTILSRYTATDPRDLKFSTGPHGKPFLADHHIRFNLSHSENFGLLAIARDAEVGVDIEHIDPRRTAGDIAARYFSASEQAELARYAGRENIAAFFRGWSRKEAVIKALGEGLACPLDSFDVTLDASKPRLLALRREHADVAAWNMVAIDAETNYAAAAAVIGHCEYAAGYHFG